MDVMENLVKIVCDAMEADGCIGHCNHPPCFGVERVVNALIANGVTVQEQDGCEHCRAASYTENPFTVITQMGREVKTQFNFCPNCSRRLLQQPTTAEANN